MRCSWLLLPFLEWFFCFTFSEELAQPIQPALPQPHALADPLPGEPEALWSDPAIPHPPDLLGADHPALLEDLKMLEHRRERDRERLGQPADRDRTAAQPLEHRPSCGVVERVEDPVDMSLVKHLL